MSAYSDNQEIEDLIVDISISIEEADKAVATMSACKSALNKSIARLKKELIELAEQGEEQRELAAKYGKQVADIMLASLINQAKLDLAGMIERQNDDYM